MARVALVGVVLTDLAWALSMVWGWWQGHVPAATVVLAWLLAGAMGALPLRWLWHLPVSAPMTLWWCPVSGGQTDGAGASEAAWGQLADWPWWSHDGQPVEIKVLADLGLALVVRVQVLATSGPRRTSIYWIDQSMLGAAWRWRFVRSPSLERMACSPERAMKAVA
jgi:hypothetical protein